MSGGFSAKVEDDALKRAGGKCEYCGGQLKPGRYQFDHEKPKALGGDNSLENCKVACIKCHLTKTIDADMPSIRKGDRKATRQLEVASGMSEIARRFGVKP